MPKSQNAKKTEKSDRRVIRRTILHGCRAASLIRLVVNAAQQKQINKNRAGA
jgi:predicted double-glycine peptidase